MKILFKNIVLDSRIFRDAKHKSITWKVKNYYYAIDLAIATKDELWGNNVDKLKFVSIDFKHKGENGYERSGIYIGRYAIVIQKVRRKH